MDGSFAISISTKLEFLSYTASLMDGFLAISISTKLVS